MSQNIRNKIYVYRYLWQDNDQFVPKVKHIITKKQEIFSRKGLASIIANTVNIIKAAIAEKLVQQVKIPQQDN